MKRLVLLKLESMLTVFRLLEIRFSPTEFMLSFWSTERDIINPQTLRTLTVSYYNLFKVCYYRDLPYWATIRAEVWLFGKHYSFTRKIEESDELPF
ncbi:hypothetical protein [Spirosoma litoris]